MSWYHFRNPSAIVARGIENLVIAGEESDSLWGKALTGVVSRAMSLTLFPVSLTLEILCKKIPKVIGSISCFQNSSEEQESLFYKQVGKITDYSLCLLSTPLGLYSPEAVSGFRLKNQPSSDSIKPFGVEEIYGKKVDGILYPKTIEDVQRLVLKANSKDQQISIIGAGMSQGTQTLPNRGSHLVIHTKYLDQIEIDPKNNIATVGAGSTWAEVQMLANRHGKSVIVKQASGVFSVGGSIGINCHGWAHEFGAIASTVKSMTIVDAQGEIKVLKPSDELFKCMFGTLGYFGIICSVQLMINDNEYLTQQVERISPESFIKEYEKNIKSKNIPLFGGRLSLYTSRGNYFRNVQMLSYISSPATINRALSPIITSKFKVEIKWGKRIEQIFLQTLVHLPMLFRARLLDYFWKFECGKMQEKITLTKNEALHPPINALTIFHASNLHAHWLQEYFIKPENLSNFVSYLGNLLKKNNVLVINATIRPTPKDSISILPYAETDRYAIVICFYQKKTKKEIAHTRGWIEEVNQYLENTGDIFYQAYMPYATREQFENCYGAERVEQMRALKKKYDPENRFGNEHTAKYFDSKD